MRFGCIGYPVLHSFSTDVHRLLMDDPYELFALSEKDLPRWLASRDFDAVNVTIPYKKQVIPFLDSIDTEAANIGAVNTIVNRNGRLFGYNTDVFGMRQLFRHTGISPFGKTAAILGTGGTSLTAQFVLAQSGAKTILRVSRSSKDRTLTYRELIDRANEIDLLINTTPCGMYPDDEKTPIDLSPFSSLDGIVDTIYHPLRTKLVGQALSYGIKAEGGLYMLVAQAIRSSEIFLAKTYAPTKVDEVFDQLLRQKTNIVLIGMPSCGKTSVGYELSNRLARPFFDSDDEITRQFGKTPAQIINEQGEAFFRAKEEAVIADLARRTGAVIACGGGVIVRSENICRLKRNGRVYWLDRPLHLLLPSPLTPLTDTARTMHARYHERLPLYRSLCDARIDASETIEATTNMLVKDFLTVFR